MVCYVLTKVDNLIENQQIQYAHFFFFKKTCMAIKNN